MPFRPPTAGTLSCLSLLSLASMGSAAELGDFDGDGRLSIADVVWRMNGRPPAAASLDGFFEYPCYPEWVERGVDLAWIDSDHVYLESLRRSVPGSLANWISLPAWRNRGTSQDPLPSNPEVSVHLLSSSAPGGGDDRARITIRLSTKAKLRAFSLMLEGAGEVLRVPYLSKSFDIPSEWATVGTKQRQSLGDLPVYTPFQAYLITNGLYVINYGLVPELFDEILPGDYAVIVEARLPKGTSAGQYGMMVHPASEVLLEDYTVVAPERGPPATLSLASEVTAGWDEGVPPLRFDAAGQRVLGKVEFRLADASGAPAADESPVIEAAPGESIGLRVQMRTEVPLNAFSYRLEWSSLLKCSRSGYQGIELLFTDPEDGSVYPSLLEYELQFNSAHALSCYTPLGDHGTGHRAEFGLLGSTGSWGGLPPKHKDRPLEYFKPLNEWRDLVEVSLRVHPCAAPGTEISLAFRNSDVTDRDTYPRPSFVPYWQRLTCNSAGLTQYWSYDVVFHDSFIRVSGDPLDCPPDDPPDLGVRFALGDASGKLGEIVEVPVLASTELPAHFLRLGLEADPPEIPLLDALFNVESFGQGKTVVVDLARGDKFTYRECLVPGQEDSCTYGIPGWMANSDVVLDPRFALLGFIVPPFDKWETDEAPPDYPGRELREIARLRVKIPETFTGDEIRLRGAQVPTFGGALIESGGFPRQAVHQAFSPAKEFRGGIIRVLGEERQFVRGDANLDGRVDLSDAVGILGNLFLGGPALACVDGADTDDSGLLDVTDPVFLLGVMFLGVGVIPEPHPDCGPDGSHDPLGCRESGCPRE